MGLALSAPWLAAVWPNRCPAVFIWASLSHSESSSPLRRTPLVGFRDHPNSIPCRSLDNYICLFPVPNACSEVLCRYRFGGTLFTPWQGWEAGKEGREKSKVLSLPEACQVHPFLSTFTLDVPLPLPPGGHEAGFLPSFSSSHKSSCVCGVLDAICNNVGFYSTWNKKLLEDLELKSHRIWLLSCRTHSGCCRNTDCGRRG